MAEKPIASVAKYYYLWKRKSQMREKIRFIDKLKQGLNSAEPDHES